MNDFVRVGRVGRPHGLGGAFFVEEASSDPQRFRVGARLVVAGSPAEVVESKYSGGRPVIRLDRPVERGTTLEVDRAELPPTDDDEYYTFQLVGLEVVEENGRVLGTVADVLPGVANDVLSLDGGALLPMVEDCVRSIDLDAARIVVAEGFAD